MGFNSLMDDIDKRMDEIKLEMMEEEITEKSRKLPCEKCGEKAYSVEGFSQDEDIVSGHLRCKNCGYEFVVKKNLR